MGNFFSCYKNIKYNFDKTGAADPCDRKCLEGYIDMGVFTSCSSTEKPDRNGLVSMMEQYLNALSKHDTLAVPFAEDVKFVENTATGGPTQFKIFVADPVAGQIAFMGVIEEKNMPVILGARLKVVKGKITEVDHLVVHSNGQPLNPNMSQVRQAFVEPVTPAERVPREEMLKIAVLVL